MQRVAHISTVLQSPKHFDVNIVSLAGFPVGFGKPIKSVLSELCETQRYVDI